MGTRHLIIVKLDGKVKIAQYGQWDGYPTGQGKNIAKFLRPLLKNKDRMDKFKARVKDCKFLTDKELKLKYFNILKHNNPTITFTESNLLEHMLPELHRNTSAKILRLVYKGVNELRDDSEFIKDKIFNEWTYIIDLDKRSIEILDLTKPFKKMSFAKFCEKNAMEKLEQSISDE